VSGPEKFQTTYTGPNQCQSEFDNGFFYNNGFQRNLQVSKQAFRFFTVEFVFRRLDIYFIRFLINFNTRIEDAEENDKYC